MREGMDPQRPVLALHDPSLADAVLNALQRIGECRSTKRSGSARTLGHGAARELGQIEWQLDIGKKDASIGERSTARRATTGATPCWTSRWLGG